jgi:hypothetical protein
MSFLGPAQAGASLLRVAGKGIAEGALQGGATGFGENVGTTDGAFAPTMGGAAAGGLLGGIAAPIAAKIAARGGPTGSMERASRRLLNAEDVDAALPIQVPVIPSGAGMPRPMAIDVAGPAVTAEVKAATRTIPGQARVAQAFGAREKELPAAINLGVKDAKVTEERLVQARSAQAKTDYADAIEATKGQPVASPSLGKLLETPTGKAAWAEVVKSRPDLVLSDPTRALPVVVAPDGTSYAVAVLIADTTAPVPARQKLIQQVASVVAANHKNNGYASRGGQAARGAN